MIKRDKKVVHKNLLSIFHIMVKFSMGLVSLGGATGKANSCFLLREGRENSREHEEDTNL